MKRFLCLILITVLLCSCSGAKLGEKTVLFKNEDEKFLTHVTFYNDSGDAACLYADEDEYYITTKSGTDSKLLYTLPENSYAYELYANDGIIAFFERQIYENRDERCILRVIDTENGEIYTPFSKVIIFETYDVQSRFIEVVGRDVYYITSSFALEETRIMKYTVGDDEPTEFATVPMTENEFTYNHSITCMDVFGDKLVAATVTGYDTHISIYDLKTGEANKKKLLPINVGVVYSVAYSDDGTIGLFYQTVDNEGKFDSDIVGYIGVNDSEITPLYTLSEGEYVNRETIFLDGDLLTFSIQLAKENDDVVSHEDFYGMMFNIENKKSACISGSLSTFSKDGKLYDLVFDKKDAKTVSFTETEIK